MGVVEHLVGHYGYLAVAVGVGAESMGLPLPGETILVAAAAYAGATGHLSTAVVVAVAAAAAVGGDNVGYWVGRRLGARVLAGVSRRLGRRARHLQAVLAMFERYGSGVVVAGRFVSVARTYAAFGAGATGMRWRRFLILNSLGGVGWAALVGFGASALGARIGTSLTYVLTGTGVLAAAAVALVLRARDRRTPTTPLAPRPSAPTAAGNAGATDGVDDDRALANAPT